MALNHEYNGKHQAGQETVLGSASTSSEADKKWVYKEEQRILQWSTFSTYLPIAHVCSSRVS